MYRQLNVSVRDGTKHADQFLKELEFVIPERLPELSVDSRLRCVPIALRRNSARICFRHFQLHHFRHAVDLALPLASGNGAAKMKNPLIEARRVGSFSELGNTQFMNRHAPAYYSLGCNNRPDWD